MRRFLLNYLFGGADLHRHVAKTEYSSLGAMHQHLNGSTEEYYSKPIRDSFGMGNSCFAQAGPWEPSGESAFYPNVEQYLDRRRTCAGTMPQDVTVPTGWPQALGGSLAWQPEHLVEEDFVHRLVSQDLEEIHAALQYFKGCAARRSYVN